MSDSPIASRKALLERGWYVIQDVETAFLGLSGRAHDVLIVIKHLQGGNSAAAPSQQLIAKTMRRSLKTIQRALDELCSKGAITSRRTGRANRYSVVYCLGTVAEIRVLMGGEVQIPDELLLSDTTHADVSDATDPDVAPSFKELTPKNNNNPLPSGGGDAAAPHSDSRLEDTMRNPRPAVDDLDPADALGLWTAQETPDAAADGLEGLFPAEEVTPAPTARQKPARSQAQRDTAGSLAFEFEQMVRTQPWAGPAPVNKAALAKNLAAWKRDGLSADLIRQMMRTFVTETAMHKPHKAPWIQFISRRHDLLTLAERRTKAEALETTRDDPDYFLGDVRAYQPNQDDAERLMAEWNAA